MITSPNKLKPVEFPPFSGSLNYFNILWVERGKPPLPFKHSDNMCTKVRIPVTSRILLNFPISFREEQHPPWSERGCFARIIIRFEQQEIHKIFPDFPPGGRLWLQLNSGSVETEKVLSANLEMVVLFAVMFRGLGVVKNRKRVGAQANRQLS